MGALAQTNAETDSNLIHLAQLMSKLEEADLAEVESMMDDFDAAEDDESLPFYAESEN